MSQQLCEIQLLTPVEELGEELDYLIPAADYLVIVLQMRFDCHGYITGWSAHTYLNSVGLAIYELNHDITFQLWRPSPDSADSCMYNLVGSQRLDFFVKTSLQNGLTIIDDRAFFNFTSVQPRNSNGEMLIFQPGDIIGWYIHSTNNESSAGVA